MSLASGPLILRSYSNELRRQGTLCDVNVKVGDRSFPCHRIILASAVKYFRNMFTKNYNEAQQKEIELKGVRADDFELLLNRIYGSPVSLNDGTNAYRLLRISHYLHLESLEELFAHYLANINLIPLGTVINIYIFANKIEEKTFSDALADYIAKNFITALKTDRKVLLYLSGHELLKIFTQPNFLRTTATAVSLLDFLTCWTKLQSNENTKFLSDLLDEVNLDSVPKEWFIKFMTEKSDTFEKGNKRKKEEMSLRDLEVDAYENEHLLFDTDLDCSLEASYLQKTTKLPFTLYTHDYKLKGDENISFPEDSVPPDCINRYKLENSNNVLFWNLNFENSQLNFNANFLKTTVVDGVRFIIMSYTDEYYDDGFSECSTGNGSDGRVSTHLIPFSCTESENHKLSKYDLFGPVYKNWTGWISEPAMASSGREIFIHFSGLLHIYNCETGFWYTNSRSFKIVTIGSNLLSYNNSLYTIGGSCPTHCKNCWNLGKHFQRYDIREGKSSVLRNTKYAHIHSASCIYNDMLYVTGGEYLSYYKGYIEYFDFRAGKWNVFESSLPCPKFGHTLIAYDNKLWFFGGLNYVNVEETFKSDLTWCFYDMTMHEWSDIVSLPSKVDNRFLMKYVFDVSLEI